MNRNIPEEFENTFCKNCGHKKASHYTLPKVEEGQPMPPSGCKEHDCDCGRFVSENKES